MLSNCILSMSNTSLPPLAFYPFILPSCILPTSRVSLSLSSRFLFLPISYLPSLSVSCPRSPSLPLSVSLFLLHPYLLRLTCVFHVLFHALGESGDASLLCVYELIGKRLIVKYFPFNEGFLSEFK